MKAAGSRAKGLALRHLVFICLAMLLLAGCDRSAKTTVPGKGSQLVFAEPTPSEVWNSSGSSVEQLLKALNQLVPKGTTRDEAVRILGKRGTWTRYADHWSLEYQFYLSHPTSPTCITLRFEPALESAKFTEAMAAYTLAAR